MELQATKEIRVFIDKGSYGSTKLEGTQVNKIPINKRIDLSWKGCYYIIQPNEKFKFDRTNNWDSSFFLLDNGVEFKIECGDPKAWITRNGVNIL